MSRTGKDRGRHTKCPEGRACDWCGPKVRADHRLERTAPAFEQTCGACGSPEGRCLCFHEARLDPWFMDPNEMAWDREQDEEWSYEADD